MCLPRARTFQDTWRNGVSFIDYLCGKFLMQMGQKIAPVLDQAYFIILVQQETCKARARAATSND
jgi:hypothetical protein